MPAASESCHVGIVGCACLFGVQKLHLTSSHKRVAANALYQSLGFERYETNCYVMEVGRG